MEKTQTSKVEQDLLEIFERAARIDNPDSALVEGTVSHLLNEEISQDDINQVKRAIDTSSLNLKSVDLVLDRLKKLGVDISNMTLLVDYVDSLKKALDQADKSLADVSFASGAISSFMGRKLSLPQITQAAITISGKANSLANAIYDSMGKLVDNIVPLVKTPELKSMPLGSILGTEGMPTAQKVKNSLEKIMSKSMGGGFFGKLKSFFGKPQAGELKKIMSMIPDFNTKFVAGNFVDAILNLSVDQFEKAVAANKDPVKVDQGSIAKVAKQAKEEEVAEEKAEKKGTPPPASPQESKEAQASAEEKIKTAVQTVAKTKNQSPKIAAKTAIDKWAKSLSKSSQKDLTAKNRLVDLKDIVDTAFVDAAKDVEAQVSAAVQAWRDEHEAQLIKNKRFSKKNFDSLQSMIPKLAGLMLKTKKESKQSITYEMTKKKIHGFLNDVFLEKQTDVLVEGYKRREMLQYRLNKLAGLKND